MSATPYLPREPSTRTAYATVLAVDGGRVDLDYGDGDPVTGVGCYGAVPLPGDRVLTLIQGSGCTVLADRPADVPRLRGVLPDKAVATGVSTTWDGTLSSYTQDRVTWAPSGTVTFAEAGMYVIGGNLTSSTLKNETSRMLIAWTGDGGGPRTSMGTFEDVMAFSFVVGIPASGTGSLSIYQSTGATVTLSSARLNIARIADL